MRPPNKSRSRNKNNRRNNNNSGGNVLNRVYDSAGPDGRVRGTPVQVIEKYQALAHDNSLAGDRVAMENFQQHAEHYIRLINDAQRQLAERREQMEMQNQSRNAGGENSNPNNRNGKNESQPDRVKEAASEDLSQAKQPDLVFEEGRAEPQKNKPSEAVATTDVEVTDSGGLVDTPEGEASQPKPEKPKRQRRPKQTAPKESKAEEVRPSE